MEAGYEPVPTQDMGASASVSVGGASAGVGFREKMNAGADWVRQKMANKRTRYADLTRREKMHEQALHAQNFWWTFASVSMITFHAFITVDVIANAPVIQNMLIFLICYAVINGVAIIGGWLAYGIVRWKNRVLFASARNSTDRISSMLLLTIVFGAQLVLLISYRHEFGNLNPHYLVNVFNLNEYRTVVQFGTQLYPWVIFAGITAVASITEPPFDSSYKMFIF